MAAAITMIVRIRIDKNKLELKYELILNEF